MNLKSRLNISLVLLGLILVSSCSNDPESPGWSYFHDMRYSQAYETYTDNPNFEDGKTARMPVEGTIARGMLPPERVGKAATEEAYHVSYLYKKYFNDTPEDYERAGETLKNPIKVTDEVLSEGQQIYVTNCIVCHGATGEGNGSIVESGAFPPVPNYTTQLKDKTVGKMFHSITYGRNLMGAYSSQTSVDERWKVIHYIQQLVQAETTAEEETTEGESADTTASAN